MIVRRLTGDDAQTWRALRLESLATYPEAFLTTHAEVAAVPLADVVKALETGHSFGCFEGSALIGIASLVPHTRVQTSHRAELSAFFVTPMAQGGKAAHTLLHGVFDAAATLGIRQIELYVASSNARAIAFYDRQGFVEAGRIPNATLGDSGPETDVIMIRALV